ncbi:CidA/LrgA family protein [Coraliomargarita sp. SDUM461003]|uniref:CidA/LrgA family protein n=1 Tax=Thalassobacterium maritimum TaxID=3041265 RepID=A0ABU1AW70_9BACT|nr:CidA/LrgA family protein [Coraliomargarita sp. SDUM461003]MDQ8208399.1 CidA/LrgA family protein [Coraliomargarita sp. SDUM461003]
MKAQETITRRFTHGSAGLRGLQILALMLLCWLAQLLTSHLQWPIPGSLVGLFVLWLLLNRKVLPAAWVEDGANDLLNHLMLFFVPAMLALVDRPELLSMLGVKLLIAVLISTLAVMCGTACVVEIGFRLKHD